jgi:hypothetical protein
MDTTRGYIPAQIAARITLASDALALWGARGSSSADAKARASKPE